MPAYLGLWPSREPRAAVGAFLRGALEADLTKRTSVFSGVGLLPDLEPDETCAPLAEVQEILIEEVLDPHDAKAFRSTRLDLVGIFLAQEVLARYAAKGLQN